MTSKNPNPSIQKQNRTHSAAIPKTTSDDPTKLEKIVDLLRRKDGACLEELCTATGWQSHSVRGAIAGALKKKGHLITSEKIDSVRRYRIGAPQ